MSLRSASSLSPVSVIPRTTSQASASPQPSASPAATVEATLAGGAFPVTARLRVESVDILRGLVIVVMALDHVREYFSLVRGLDLAGAPLAYFLTRWVTHFCAPTFCFLAGTSAFLSRGSRRTPSQLSRFLLTRGLWLVLMEVTVVNFGWFFHTNYPFDFGFGLQVIWSLGVSMMVLAGLVRLPLWVSVAVGAAMVAGHNLLDGIAPETFGVLANVWRLLHIQEQFPLGPFNVFVAYPLVPWIGVMALGYAFGALLTRPRDGAADAATARPTAAPETTGAARAARRACTAAQAAPWRLIALAIGLALTLAFIVLRALNGYGDPSRWAPGPDFARTAAAFLNTSKYPPSLLYLLMTLGPAIAALAWLERWKGPVGRAFACVGRVPFFFYIVHIYAIHTASVAAGWMQGFPIASMMDFCFFLPKGYGFSLPVVYVIWATIVLALYPLCRWFDGVKARNRDRVWLSYL